MPYTASTILTWLNKQCPGINHVKAKNLLFLTQYDFGHTIELGRLVRLVRRIDYDNMPITRMNFFIYDGLVQSMEFEDALLANDSSVLPQAVTNRLLMIMEYYCNTEDYRLTEIISERLALNPLRARFFNGVDVEDYMRQVGFRIITINITSHSPAGVLIKQY